MLSITFVNSNDEPIYLQVDPWAGLYIIPCGSEIEIAAECNSSEPSFEINEYGNNRILLLADSIEYFVRKDGRLVHWTQFQTNVE